MFTTPIGTKPEEIDSETRALNVMFDKNAQTMREKEKSLLTEADALINGQRQSDYGDKLQNFAQIAMGFQMVLARKLQPGEEITPEDVALCMNQVKVARLTASYDHRDSILDVAGYAGCYDKIREERKAGYKLHGATHDAGSL